MSEFHVECVKIGEVTKHPNADTLSCTLIHNGYPVLFKTGDFNEGDLACYIPIDALVQVSRPEFAFLDSGKGRAVERIKARRLRGVFSMGLLIRAPVSAKAGDDLREWFGVEKWEPESEKEPAPDNRKARRSWHRTWFGSLVYRVRQLLGLAPPTPPKVPVYDIEGLRKYQNLFQEGEAVVIREKIHGCSSRYLHTGKHFFIGSRTVMTRNGPSVWKTVADRYCLKEKLKRYPGVVLHGEVYGSVQDLKYGVPESEDVRFVAFDALVPDGPTNRRWLNDEELEAFCALLGLPMAPVLYRGPWHRDLVKLAEGKTTMPGANHVREGFVVRPVAERHDQHFGRVQLKLAGQDYLTRKDARD
jgi:tRNA-binding EMAP/Myf-like protein